MVFCCLCSSLITHALRHHSVFSTTHTLHNTGLSRAGFLDTRAERAGLGLKVAGPGRPKPVWEQLCHGGSWIFQPAKSKQRWRILRSGAASDRRAFDLAICWKCVGQTSVHACSKRLLHSAAHWQIPVSPAIAWNCWPLRDWLPFPNPTAEYVLSGRLHKGS